MKKASKKVRFEVEAEAGNTVAVAGTFNDWDVAKHPLKDNPGSGKYATTLALVPGRHEYKFVINGEWCIDPNCPECAPNDHGTLNSVLHV